MRKMTKKILSTSMIGLALAACSIAGGSFAMAQEGQVVTGAVEGGDVSGEKIESSHPISLTVKKTRHNPYDDSQSGISNASGVRFTLSKVKGVDVTNDSVRKKVVKNYSYQYIMENNLPITKVQDGKTDDKGFISFTGLKPGLYILDQEGEKDTPEVIMLPMVDSDGMSFHYDNLIVTKNFDNTPPPSSPHKTPSNNDGEKTPPQPSEEKTPPQPSEEKTPPQDSTQSTTPSSEVVAPPQDNTPPPSPNETPLFPGGPIVNTGGMGIPSLTGEGNMSISTMLIFLAMIFGVGFGANKAMRSKIEKED